MVIIRTPSSSKKTKRHLKVKSKRNPQLDAEWEKLMAKHSSPLEKGAKSKGSKVKSVVATSPQVTLPPAKSEVTFEMSKMVGSTAKPPSKVYTGTAVVGIATLHKSNSIPVFSTEEAVEVAKMRRN